MTTLEMVLSGLLAAVVGSTLVRDWYYRRLVEAVVRLVYARATLSENGAADSARTEHERVILRAAAVGFREAAGEIERRLLDGKRVEGP